MLSSPAYLNGEYLALNDCKISVLDRGFIFGDSVYEVLPVYNGKPFRLTRHLERLSLNLTATRIPNPYSNAQWQAIIETLITQAGSGDCYIYVQVTRGVAPRDHALPKNITPTVFAMAQPLPKNAPEILAQGVRLHTVDDIRWRRCDIKVTCLLPNVLAKQEALEHEANEAIFINNGYAVEGSSSNLFILINQRVFTHPKDHLILPGVTRDFVIELVKSCNIVCREEQISVDQLFQADEIWISSSTREVLPATRINGKAVGAGRPGMTWSKIYNLYQEVKLQG